MNILVTDCNHRVGLTILRSLGSAGHKVVPSSSQKNAVGFSSKYSERNYIYPNTQNISLFQKEFYRHIRKQKYDMIFLSNESTILALLPVMSKLKKVSKIAVVSNDHVSLSLDKTKTMSKLNASNIKNIQDSLPRTYTFTSISDFISTQFTNYPLIIKPRQSSFISDNRVVNQHKVYYAKDYKELKYYFLRICREFKLKSNNLPIVQEFIPGKPFGFFALLKKGKIVAHFSHRRIREYPPTGGPSTYRESFFDEKLMNLGTNILQHLKWDGIAMVEFRKDERDGKYKFIEINGRFWGSLRLAVVSEVDFPTLYQKVLVNDNIPSFNRYKQGIRCRWFMPGDINYLRKITSLKSISNMQKFHCILNWFYFNRNDYYDYYTFDDPLPALLATKRELINWLRKRLN